MRLRYIELFHAIIATGSLTGAARVLHISQPAASKALQHAESQLGFALFSRVRGRLKPTPQALLMRARIEKIIHEVNDLGRLTRTLADPDSSPLRITCTPTLAESLLPVAVVQLREQFPQARVELSTHHTAAMCKSLTLREVDIGFTLQDVTEHNLHQQALCKGRVMVIAPPGTWPEDELHKPLPVAQLAGQEMIGITTRDALGDMLQGCLAEVEPAPKTPVWVQTYQLAHALVARGEGMALIDPFTAGNNTGASVAQKRPLAIKLDVALHAICRLDSPLTAIQSRFLELLGKVAKQAPLGT